MDEPLSVTIREYYALIVRRKFLVSGTILMCLIVAALLCVILPRSYRSSTLIVIENPKIPQDIVKGIVGGGLEERLAMLQQQIMSRTVLSQLIEEFKLYSGGLQDSDLESKVEAMRKAIKVDFLGARGKSIEAFTISFAHENPETAMKVTASLGSHFIDENLKVREQMVTGVSTFLSEELKTAKAALERQEKAISRFRAKYMGLLPEQIDTNLRALDRLQLDLTATDELIRGVSDKLGLVNKSIKEYEVNGVIRQAPGIETAPQAQTAVDPLVTRLRELERTLTTLLAEYKETYPDVVNVRQQIEAVKKQITSKYGESTNNEESKLGVATAMDPYLRELMRQRDELSVELSSLKDRRRRLSEQIVNLEERVEQTPAREQELTILERDYENMQKNYQALLDKKLNAHVAENLEKRQKGEQFRVLDPANLPKNPEKPNRLLIMFAGLFGGCVLGAGLAIGLEQLNPTFKRREEIETLPGIRVLAAIPNFHSMTGANVYGQRRKDRNIPLLTSDLESRVPAIGPGVSVPFSIADMREDNHHRINTLVTKWQPFSVAAEQYRMAASRLVLSTEGRQSTIIGITSALKNEGKTTTVVNLGYTLARDFRRRTLLIDCDFRCPALHDYVNLPARAGLIELLDGLAGLDECFSAIDEIPCSILTVSGSNEDQNELVRIQQLKALLPELRSKFDYIIFNTPPVLPCATMSMLASLADILIMVVRAGVTPKHLVQQAFTTLGITTEAKVILNAVEADSMPAYVYGYPVAYGSQRLLGTSYR